MPSKRRIVVGGLLILICVVMFSFLKSFFQTTNTEAVVPLRDTTSDADREFVTTPNVMDFTGADKVVVIRTDYTQPEKPTTRHEIVNQETVTKIVTTLSTLPKNGEIMISMGPTIVHKVVAFKNELPFAYIEFYGESLKTEDTSFYTSDQGARAGEALLFALISQ